MEITKRILLAAVVVITCACQKTKESQVTVVSDKKEQTASEIHRLPLYDHSDTVRMGSHLYAFAIFENPIFSSNLSNFSIIIGLQI